jgi:hypothetical protein
LLAKAFRLGTVASKMGGAKLQPLFFESIGLGTATKIPIYVFLFWELHGLSPNFHMCVTVSDFNIPRIGPYTAE